MREIGSGGMGSVYLAVRDDDSYRQQVAIKLVRSGLANEFVLRRFRNEMQILAELNHPNIARLLDGGTTADGRPFLVMEYVEGVPINSYCESRRLPVVERLELWLCVASAVEYAHQHLVVHCDIKPGNIVVPDDGSPNLLGFGIARLVKADALDVGATATELAPMTPEYASPEQVRGETITTASDVYSLGILLFELLSGRRPYELEGRTPFEIARVICEQEPRRP